MNTLERFEQQESFADFGMDFDINAAFQSAMMDVASDAELTLDEKVRRMESLVTQSTSQVYRDFVDFRQMAAQMEMMCAHDHMLTESVGSNETLAGFLNNHNDRDEHGRKDEEIDPKTGKKKKKKLGWLSFRYKA